MTAGTDGPNGREARSARLLKGSFCNKQGGSEGTIVIRNISSRGLSARLVSGRLPAVGDPIVIALGPIREIQASVRWVKGDSFGLLLAHDVELAQLDVKPPASTASHEGFIPGHVYDYFRPEQRTWRPGFRSRPQRPPGKG